MRGPSVATMFAGSAPLLFIRSTVAPITPRSRPRRPQWAAPMIPVTGSPSSTGRQSAANMPRAMPDCAVTWPSASMTCGVSVSPCVPDTSKPKGVLMTNESSTSTATPECTWETSDRRACTASASAMRFDSTASGSSPDLPPRFRLP